MAQLYDIYDDDDDDDRVLVTRHLCDTTWQR